MLIDNRTNNAKVSLLFENDSIKKILGPLVDDSNDVTFKQYEFNKNERLNE